MVITMRAIAAAITITAPKESLSLFIGFLPQQGALQTGDACSRSYDHPVHERLLTPVRVTLIHAVFRLTLDNSTDTDKEGQFVAKNCARAGAST